MTSTAAKLTALALAAALLPACADHERSAHNYTPTVAVAWFEQLYALVRDNRIGPPPASRMYGYAGVALYEAVVAGMPHHQSLGLQLHGLGPLPTRPAAVVDWPAAANGALAVVVRSFFATNPASVEAVDALAERLAAEREYLAGADEARRSRAYGEEVGSAIVAWASGDGAVANLACAYTAPVGPSLWRPTAPAFAAPAFPCWGRLRTFALPTAATCAIAPPNPYSSSAGSNFHGQMFEVYSTGAHLDDEQRTIALYWADGPGATGTPPGHWIRIVGNHVTDQDLRLDLAAEAYARVGIAVAGAFISCWSSKYVYNTVRPITYVRERIDPAWSPLIATPNFPDYPSGHSVQSGAAAEQLALMFGEVPFTDRTHADRGFADRTFAGWSAAAEEAAISRLYGGIHYRDSIELGVEQGRCIAREIEAAVRFRR